MLMCYETKGPDMTEDIAARFDEICAELMATNVMTLRLYGLLGASGGRFQEFILNQRLICLSLIDGQESGSEENRIAAMARKSVERSFDQLSTPLPSFEVLPSNTSGR
jgi:hypothetical protein